MSNVWTFPHHLSWKAHVSYFEVTLTHTLLESIRTELASRELCCQPTLSPAES